MNVIEFVALRRVYPVVLMAFAAAASFAPMCAVAGDASPASAETKTAASASNDQWRFVWHNNQWWYYQPNGQWMIHDGSAWHAPQAVAATQAYRPATSYGGYQPQPRYRQFMGSGRNGNGMSNDGFWGNSPRYWTYQHVLGGS